MDGEGAKAKNECPVACGECPTTDAPTDAPTDEAETDAPTDAPTDLAETDAPTDAPTDTPVCCGDLDPTLCNSQSRPART